MDWLSDTQEEYYYLQLGESLKVSLFQGMLEKIKNGHLKLSAQASGAIIDIVARHYKEQSRFNSPTSLSDKDFKVLNCAVALLECEPSAAEVIHGRGPEAVKGTFPLQAFLAQPQGGEHFRAGLSMVRALIELCPGFGDWRTFVAADDTGVVEAALSKALAGVTPAKQLISGNKLAIRKEVSLANEIVESLSKAAAAGGDQKLGADLDRFSVLENIGNIFGNLLDSILKFGEKQQEEILDKSERLAHVSVQSALTELRRTLESGDHPKVVEAHHALVVAQDNLIKIQLGRRHRKAERFATRIAYLKQLAASPTQTAELKEMLVQYSSNLDRQQRTIQALEKVYRALAAIAKLSDVSTELLFLDQQIANLYDVSISVVVSGMVKVGKSTVLNCITGENLSPHRGSTMTAIPTRFVHDASRPEPLMLVPFADELNSVARKLKQLVNADPAGLAPYKGVLSADHYRLLEAITKGLTFASRYEGTPAIMDISIAIHDIFRLAVNDMFGGELSSELPMDWSQGLDSYLTVYLKFPGAEMVTGLVTFSVVDTPGIDEAEVRKLNLHNTVRSALTVSNIGVVVVPNDGTVHAAGYQSLKEMSKTIRQRYHTPMMVIATRSESQSTDDRRKQEIANALAFDVNSQTFTLNEIFFVSGLKMFVGTRMLKYLETHPKPGRDHKDPWIRNIVQDFVDIAGQELTPEDNEEWYDGLSKDKLVERARKLADSSQMPRAMNHIMTTTLIRGIPIIIQTTINKVAECIENFCAQFEHRVDHDNLRLAKVECGQEMSALGTVVQRIKSDLLERRESLRKELEVLSEQGKRELEQRFLQQPLTDKETLDSLLGNINSYTGTLSDDKVKDLVRQEAKVGFSTNQDAQKAIIALSGAFKRGIEEFLSRPAQRLPAELLLWTRRQQAEINSHLARIRALFAAKIGLQLPGFQALAMEEIFQEETSRSVNFAAQKMVESTNRLATMFSSLTRFFGFKHQLVPKEVRKLLVEQSFPVLRSTTASLNSHIDHVFRELTRVFVEEIAAEAHSINDIANSKLWEITMTMVVMQGQGHTTLANVDKDQLVEAVRLAVRGLQALLDRNQPVEKVRQALEGARV